MRPSIFTRVKAAAAASILATAAAGFGVLAVPASAAAASAAAASAAAASAKNVCDGQAHSDKLTYTPWPLQRLNPRAAWPLSRGKGVIVAVIDTGISTTPAVLSAPGKVLPGYDYLDKGKPARCDIKGHGTLVAAIIAGSDPNKSFFYGVAPDAKLLPIRVMTGNENFTAADDNALSTRIADAITYAADQGHANVINLSLRVKDTVALDDAVRHALSKNVVIVAAAGNYTDKQPQDNAKVYPAELPGVIGVAGTDENDQRVATSRIGDFVDVAAPGIRIIGPAPAGGGYLEFQDGGTSFAAPYVAGVAALIIGSHPGISPAEVARRITLTADEPPGGPNQEVGAGVVNPYRAVSDILDTQDTRTPASVAKLAPAAPIDDPLRTVKFAAWSAAGGGAVLAIILLLIVPAIRGAVRRRDSPDAAPRPSI